MTDLEATLARAVTHYQERRTLAEAAEHAMPSPWEPDPEHQLWIDSGGPGSWTLHALPYDRHGATFNHLASLDPVSVIAWCDLMLALVERDRATLERHRPTPPQWRGAKSSCNGCGIWSPCPDVAAVTEFWDGWKP